MTPNYYKGKRGAASPIFYTDRFLCYIPGIRVPARSEGERPPVPLSRRALLFSRAPIAK